jgi:hypothetical protein
MMGQSSGLEMWVTPKHGQATISAFSTFSSRLTHVWRPKSSPPGCWLMCSSEGKISSSEWGVTNIYEGVSFVWMRKRDALTLWRANGARFHTSDPGLASSGGMSLDTDERQSCIPPIQAKSTRTTH